MTIRAGLGAAVRVPGAGWLALVATVMHARPVCAAETGAAPRQEPPAALRSRHRPFAAISLGVFGPVSANVNGRDYDEGAQFIGASDGNAETNDSIANPMAGVTLGYEERFVERFSLAARANFQIWQSQWSVDVGYTQSRWDLNLEPRFWLLPAGKTSEGYLSLGGGFTKVNVSPPQRRAYDERVEAVGGFNLTLSLGALFWGDTWGFFGELGYAFHRANAKATLNPRVPHLDETIEHRRYVDHGFFLSIGSALGFGRR